MEIDVSSKNLTLDGDMFLSLMAGVAVDDGEFGKALTLSLIIIVNVGLLILIGINEARR